MMENFLIGTIFQCRPCNSYPNGSWRELTAIDAGHLLRIKMISSDYQLPAVEMRDMNIYLKDDAFIALYENRPTTLFEL